MRKEVCMFSKMENFCFITKSQTTKNQARKVSKWKTFLSACPFCLAKVRQIILAEKWFYRKVLRFFIAAISSVPCCTIKQWIFIFCQVNFSSHISQFLLSYKGIFVTNFLICVTKFLIHVTDFVIKIVSAERKNYQGNKKKYHIRAGKISRKYRIVFCCFSYKC